MTCATDYFAVELGNARRIKKFGAIVDSVHVWVIICPRINRVINCFRIGWGTICPTRDTWIEFSHEVVGGTIRATDGLGIRSSRESFFRDCFGPRNGGVSFQPHESCGLSFVTNKVSITADFADG